MAAAAPPTINHMARSVGDPVNRRDTSELKDCEACDP